MIQKYSDSSLGAVFMLSTENDVFDILQKESKDHLKFIWNDGGMDFNMLVDDTHIMLPPDKILCATYLQNISFNKYDMPIHQIIVLSFNRAFYCIHTNDAEVSCNGLLFFGSNYTPIISLDENEKARLHTLIDVLNEEFFIRDQNQDEMLRILLKRFIIRCTRLARIQMSKSDIHEGQIDIIREFNVLVEEHFKRKKKVSDYADLMHRSPKTLTNVFRLHSETSPHQVIQDRITLEARRMLLYTDKPVKEIAMDLGFDEPALFSRFFKNQTGLSTQEFKEKNKRIHY